MLRYVVVLLIVAGRAARGDGWVKVANFYTPTDLAEIFTTLKKTPQDLFVLAVDTTAAQVRLPLEDAPYYGLSKSWTKLNETLYFGRLSLFVVNYANTEIEHDILRFQGNMTIGREHRSLMTLVKDEGGFSGYMCNMGKPSSKSKTVVNICLHDVVKTGNINTRLIWVIAQQAHCPDCTKYDIRAHAKDSSLEFAFPEEKRMKWNMTIEYRNSYNRHTTLCYIVKEFVPGDLNMVIMKQNLSVNTMYECVVFTELLSYDSMELWTPIIAGLVSVSILVLAAIILYKKCNRVCLRELMPTPDQDTAPYRSFNSSNRSESPRVDTADNRYIKMKTVSSSGPESEYEGYKQGHNGSGSGFLSRQSEPHYERI